MCHKTKPNQTKSQQRSKTLLTSILNMTLSKSDGEALVMLEIWGMQSTPLLTSFQSPLWPGVVAPDRVLSIGQIELFDI